LSNRGYGGAGAGKEKTEEIKMTKKKAVKSTKRVSVWDSLSKTQQRKWESQDRQDAAAKAKKNTR